jgi:hypothetical protein
VDLVVPQHYFSARYKLVPYVQPQNEGGGQASYDSNRKLRATFQSLFKPKILLVNKDMHKIPG